MNNDKNVPMMKMLSDKSLSHTYYTHSRRFTLSPARAHTASDLLGNYNIYLRRAPF